MDELTLTIIAAVLNGVSLSIGMIIGTRMTGDTLEKKMNKIIDKSPTGQTVKKILGQVDKLLGDDQAVEQITGFFRDARALVSSPEAKNFFKNAADALKDFSGKEQESVIDLPKKPKVRKI